MNLIATDNVSKSYGEKLLFEDVSFGIAVGEKVALVGANGAGKSTLMKVLEGDMPPDTGAVSTKKDLSIGFLVQETNFASEKTVWETIFDSENILIKAIKDYDKSILEGDNDLMNSSIEIINENDGWNFEQTVKEVLTKLGVSDAEQLMGSLSGGQKKRVALAKVLLEPHDILFMDEPTNHLDLKTIEWLEGFLSKQQVSLLLVTHDRYFLDNVTNTILELADQQVYKHEGDFEYYLTKKAERIENLEKEIGKAQNLYKKELDWVRRMPKARGTKAKYRVDAFKEIKKKAKQTVDKSKINIDVKMTRQGRKILELKGINKSFGDLPISENFEYIFKRGDRIGIVGKNGVGKSTFLNMITGEMVPDSGEITKGETTNFGYYKQQDRKFPDGMRVIDVMQEIAEVVQLGDGHTISMSQFLNYFKFDYKRQYEHAKYLSGGEKRRLQLMEVLAKQPNFLILDEPTNDLDLDTLTVLEDYLSNFDGCLMIVSHDRCFMDNLVEQTFAFEGDGFIRKFPGNYTDYREFQIEKEKEQLLLEKEALAKKETKQNTKEESEKTKLTYKEKIEFEGLETELETLEEKKENLVAQLSEGTLGHDEFAQLGKKLASLETELEEKTERWMYLADFA